MKSINHLIIEAEFYHLDEQVKDILVNIFNELKALQKGAKIDVVISNITSDLINSTRKHANSIASYVSTYINDILSANNKELSNISKNIYDLSL